MGVNRTHRGTEGLTVPELLAVAAVLAILAAVILPNLRPRHVSRLGCTNNLKQIGLAFKTWSIDNGDRFPMQVPTNEGGTKEFISGPKTFMHFAVMSNELSTPRILFCPYETRRTHATNFTSDLSNLKISYFVGVNALETNCDCFLSGDRTLTNDLAPIRGALVFLPRTPARWTTELHKGRGNILFPDGSVLTASTSIFITPGAMNRLSIPY